MATKSVNRTLSISSGRFEIYVDKAQQARAEKLIRSVPSILTKSYAEGTRKFGEQLLRIVKNVYQLACLLQVREYLGHLIRQVP